MATKREILEFSSYCLAGTGSSVSDALEEIERHKATFSRTEYELVASIRLQVEQMRQLGSRIHNFLERSTGR